MKYLTAIYAVVCGAALLLIPASVHGWFGVAEDPLAGIFAYLLGLPWTLVFARMSSPGPVLAIALAAIGMGANIAILLLVQRWLSHRRQPYRQGVE